MLGTNPPFQTPYAASRKWIGPERHQLARERELLVGRDINSRNLLPFGRAEDDGRFDMPDASDGLMSAIFQVRSVFQPNIFFRKESTCLLGSEALLLEAELGRRLCRGARLRRSRILGDGVYAGRKRPAAITIRVKRFMVPFEDAALWQLAVSIGP